MAINYFLTYHPDVLKKDLRTLDEKMQTRIRSFLWIKLLMAPEIIGIPLRTSTEGHRKACIDDYRVVYQIQKETILVLAIKHYSAIR